MKPIKVLEVIRQGEIGGGESHVIDLVAGFNRKEVEPIVMAFTDGHMIKTLREQGVKCYVIPTLKAFDFRIGKRIDKVIENEDIQLIHAHGSRAASNMLWTSIRSKRPMVYTVHGWSFHQDQNPFVYRLRALGEKLICHHCKEVICVSSNNLQSGKDAFGLKKNMVIENGVNMKRFDASMQNNRVREDLGIAPNEFIIGFIGRITLQKSPIDFVKSIAMAHQKDKQIKGLLVGEGDMKKEVLQYIQSNNLKDCIYLSDFRTDIPEVLQAMDVFCLPSLWEGLSIALLEAMAMGKPLVVTPTDGTRELIKDHYNGLIVGFNQPEQLAEAYLEYKNNEALMNTCGTNALKLIKEKYDSQRVSDAVTAIYQNLLS